MALLPPVVRGVAPPTGGYDSSDRLRSYRSDTSNLWTLTSDLYLHIFTGKFVRFPPFSNIHVGNLKSPRGRQKIPSEVLFRAHVENFLFPRGYFETSTWKSLFPDTALFRCVVGSKMLLRSGAVFA